MAKPSQATIARVIAAYIPQDAVVLHDFTVRTGWRIRIYPSPWTEGALIACADRLGTEGRAEALDSEVRDLTAAKVWIQGLPT